MNQAKISLKGIKDVFYQTRVLMGRKYTLKRFASEILESTVEPGMLSYIETGKRFPTEALVKRLSGVRNEDPGGLLVLLWQDRMLYAFSRELRKALIGQEKKQDIGESDIAFLVSRAMTALPDDGSWIAINEWLTDLKKVVCDLGENQPADLSRIVITILKKQGLVEEREDNIRRLVDRQDIPDRPEERHSIAMEFCGTFTKALLNKVIKKEKGTYLKNHFLQIPEEKIPAFHKQLDQTARQLAKEFSTEEGHSGKFLNVLILTTER